jgi:catechol 2,3-dioxygenase-like lactoylglutathione lyase family enzyme
MAVLRPHLALNVSDLERSVAFYTALFGVDPVKVRSRYAKFELETPALNFTLNEGERSPADGALNHAGIQVSSPVDVLAAKERLSEAGLALSEEMDTVCCYARQDKIWLRDPDGTPWEVFTVKHDEETDDEIGLETDDDAEREAVGAGAACCAGRR